jgi:hypothetical protein
MTEQSWVAIAAIAIPLYTKMVYSAGVTRGSMNVLQAMMGNDRRVSHKAAAQAGDRRSGMRRKTAAMMNAIVNKLPYKSNHTSGQ